MDEATFNGFYQKTARPLWAYLHRLTGDAALADDLLQEAFFRLLGSNAVTLAESQMKSYLYKIATNLVHDHWRRQKHQPADQFAKPPEPGSTADPATGFDLAQGFQELSLQERALLWLAYVEGNHHREMAHVLGLQEKSIRVLLFRARRKLAKLLGLGKESSK